jgi:hypothetical protein
MKCLFLKTIQNITAKLTCSSNSRKHRFVVAPDKRNWCQDLFIAFQTKILSVLSNGCGKQKTLGLISSNTPTLGYLSGQGEKSHVMQSFYKQWFE